jgi:hypothetical protein
MKNKMNINDIVQLLHFHQVDHQLDNHHHAQQYHLNEELLKCKYQPGNSTFLYPLTTYKFPLFSPSLSHRELKHAPYREESIPEERLQFIDSETYDKQTPIFQSEEPNVLSKSRVQVTETIPMIHITQPLIDTRVEQGKPLRLIVETSQPSSEAIWFKADAYSTSPNQAKKLDESGKYHMITQGTRHILIVPNATADDTGEYICRIQNAMTRAQVQVTNEDLQFIRRLPQSIDVIGGRDIIIECEMNKFDTQAIWKKDNELIRVKYLFTKNYLFLNISFCLESSKISSNFRK